MNLPYIFVAVFLGIVAFLIGPLIWRIYVNHYVTKKITFAESLALYNTSAMFKYIPGKIWTYAAQIALLSERGISAAVLIYINIVCFACLAYVAVFIALYYYFFYLRLLAFDLSILIFLLVIASDVVFILWHTKIINGMIKTINRILNIAIQPIEIPKTILLCTQIVYVGACILLGLALYFLAAGFNFRFSLTEVFAMMATVSVSALTGYLAFFTMGGLGIREGTMFFMLKQFSSVQAALILPVAARALTIVVELLMGLLGVMIGMTCHYFPRWGDHLRTANIDEETQVNIV